MLSLENWVLPLWQLSFIVTIGFYCDNWLLSLLYVSGMLVKRLILYFIVNMSFAHFPNDNEVYLWQGNVITNQLYDFDKLHYDCKDVSFWQVIDLSLWQESIMSVTRECYDWVRRVFVVPYISRASKSNSHNFIQRVFKKSE